jgi:tellurite resistance protein TehA-like permease
VWRHGYRRFPLRYSPLFWDAVFPLGLYTAGTHRLSEAPGVVLIAAIPKGFVYVAMAAWLLTFGEMTHAIVASL